MIPAPDLLEVAQIWWDVEREPVVIWDVDGRRFHLADPEDPDARLLLAVFDAPVDDPERVARAFADGLAACDFPPLGGGVAAARARVTLRAAGLDLDPRD